MCKHCVALTVAYFAQPKSFEEIGDGLPPFRRVGRRARRWRSALAARSDATPVRVGALAVDAATGTVHLAVHLAYDGRFWSMDLTVEGPRGNLCGARPEAFAHRVQRGSISLTERSSPSPIGLEKPDGPSGPWLEVAGCFPMSALFGGSMFTAGSARCACGQVASMLGAMGRR